MIGEVKVLKVVDQHGMSDFLNVVDGIYQDCLQYVPDLKSDIKDMFDKKKNPGLEFTNVQPFVAYRGTEPVGRIVGIINHRANKKWKTNNVRFSMIEFIDDPAVSKALITTVEEWGRDMGMDTIQGPMGITDFDKEGMLIEDFQLMGTMSTIYNPAYYPIHMEQLGYQKEVDWVQIRIQVPKELPARYARVAQYAKEQMGLRVIKLSNKDVYQYGYGKKIFDLLNKAYSPIFGYSSLTDAQADKFIHKYLKMIDKQLIPVVVNDEQRLVGVCITMGGMSQAMRKANGKLLPIGWYHLLKALKWRREKNAEMLLIAIDPEFQGLGVNALFFEDLIPIYNNYGFEWAETGPQLEDNVRELSQWKPLNPRFVKRRRCYFKKLIYK